MSLIGLHLLPRARKAVAVGVHGFFPMPLVRAVLGEPAGARVLKSPSVQLRITRKDQSIPVYPARSSNTLFRCHHQRLVILYFSGNFVIRLFYRVLEWGDVVWGAILLALIEPGLKIAARGRRRRNGE